jgi:hypothetical protein
MMIFSIPYYSTLYPFSDLLPMAISICYFCICFLGWQPKSGILKLVGFIPIVASFVLPVDFYLLESCCYYITIIQ